MWVVETPMLVLVLPTALLEQLSTGQFPYLGIMVIVVPNLQGCCQDIDVKTFGKEQSTNMKCYYASPH